MFGAQILKYQMTKYKEEDNDDDDDGDDDDHGQKWKQKRDNVEMLMLQDLDTLKQRTDTHSYQLGGGRRDNRNS